MKTSEVFPHLWRAVRAIMAEVQPQLRQSNLSVRSFFLLSKIEECCYPAQLAEELFMPPPTVSQVLRELEELHYINREVEQADLRRYRLSLTPIGVKMLALVQEAIGRVVDQRCVRVSRSEMKSLVQVLTVLEAKEDGPAQKPRARKNGSN